MQRFKGHKKEARRIDSAICSAMGFIQSPSSVHLQTCDKVAEIKVRTIHLVLFPDTQNEVVM